MTDATQTRTFLHPTLDVSLDEIAEFCRRHHIRWLAVFGSVLRDDFTAYSDVDVLVEYEPGKAPGLIFSDLPGELSTIFDGREIDLVTRKSLNRWIRADVLADAQVLYDET